MGTIVWVVLSMQETDETSKSLLQNGQHPSHASLRKTFILEIVGGQLVSDFVPFFICRDFVLSRDSKVQYIKRITLKCQVCECQIRFEKGRGN